MSVAKVRRLGDPEWISFATEEPCQQAAWITDGAHVELVQVTQWPDYLWMATPSSRWGGQIDMGTPTHWLPATPPLP